MPMDDEIDYYLQGTGTSLGCSERGLTDVCVDLSRPAAQPGGQSGRQRLGLGFNGPAGTYHSLAAVD